MSTPSKPRTHHTSPAAAAWGIVVLAAIVLAVALLVRYAGDTSCAHTAFNCPGRLVMKAGTCGRKVTKSSARGAPCERRSGHYGPCAANVRTPLEKQAKKYYELLRIGYIRKDDIVPANYLIQACQIASEWQLREFTRVLDEAKMAKYRRKDDTFKILKDLG
jgi:hypothetical protein